MKKFIELIPTILICVITAYLLFTFLKEDPIIFPPDETKIKQLEKQLEISSKQIDNLKFQRDSLLNASSQIETHTIYLTADIDSSIAKDSSNAIPEYRKSITLFNWIPDAADILTFREIGIGAKIITEAYGMKLQIKNYKSALSIEQQINSRYENQLSSFRQIVKLKNTAIEYWEKEFKKTQSFWDDRFIFYTGIGINYNGTNLIPGIQLGLGIRIVTIKF